MQELLEDFSRWSVEELLKVPPESLEYVDLTALVIELQDRLASSEFFRNLFDPRPT